MHGNCPDFWHVGVGEIPVITLEMVCQVYYCYVNCLKLYGIECYGSCSKQNLHCLQIIQNKFLKILRWKDSLYNIKLHKDWGYSWSMKFMNEPY